MAEMSDRDRERAAFYNRFLEHVILSAAETCGEQIERLTGEQCPHGLRQSFADLLLEMCREFQQDIGIDTSRLCMDATARMMSEVIDTTGRLTATVIERIGFDCHRETVRVFTNFVEAMAEFERSFIIDDLTSRNLSPEQWDELKRKGVDPRSWNVRDPKTTS